MIELEFELDLCLQKPKLPDNEGMKLGFENPVFLLIMYRFVYGLCTCISIYMYPHVSIDACTYSCMHIQPNMAAVWIEYMYIDTFVSICIYSYIEYIYPSKCIHIPIHLENCAIISHYLKTSSQNVWSEK